MKKLRVLVPMHEDLEPPEKASKSERAGAAWKTEFDVIGALRKLEHEVEPVGIGNDVDLLRRPKNRCS
jgi:hypothetical protein